MQEKKLIILGMGNELFGDDGAGVLVARKLQKILKDQKEITIESTNWGGFRIIDLLSGYKNAIVVDSLKTGMQPVGYIHKLDYRCLINSVRMISFHDINFATAVEFAKQMKIPMPETISVYAIEVKETETMTEIITNEVKDAVEKCVYQILDEVNQTIKSNERIYC